MHTLYIIKGSCSMGPHILLHELELEHVVEVADPSSAEFRSVNPRGKVPALATASGAAVLTEQLGIDTYLAALRPDKGLLPEDSMDRARVYEALAFANSVAHPAVAQLYFPQRYVDEAGHAAFKAGAAERFAKALGQLELLIQGPYVLGDRYSIADPYLFVMYQWALGGDVEIGSLPKLKLLGETMLQRSAVKKMLAREKAI